MHRSHMKIPGKPGKKEKKNQPPKNIGRGSQQPPKTQKIIKPTIRGR